VLVTISILFDVIHAAELPSMNKLTAGESFGATLWMFIFALKFIIIGTIFAYETYEKESEGGQNAYYEVDAREDEIAE